MNKLTLVEVAFRKTQDEFRTVKPGIWGFSLTNDYSSIFNSRFNPYLIGTEFNKMALTLKVYSVNNFGIFIDIITFKRVFNTSELYSIENSFMITDFFLEVHFSEFNSPNQYGINSVIEIGLVDGYSKVSWDADTDPEFNSQPYLQRLKSNLIISKKIDVEGRQIFPSGSVKIENGDRKYNRFTMDNEFLGNLVRILTWTGDDIDSIDYDDLNIEYQGNIISTSEGTDIGFNFIDSRKALDKKLSSRELDKTSYTDIGTEETILMPEVWGTCNSVPIICLNKDANKDIISTGFPGNRIDYEFLICDTSNYLVDEAGITEVFIEEIAASTEILTAMPTIIFDSTQNFAKITLSAELFETYTGSSKPTYSGMDKTSISLTGYEDGTLIEKGMDIIKYMLNNTYFYTYTDTYFDLTAWEAFATSVDNYKIGLFINAEITLWEIIEQISKSLKGRFIINSEEKFTWNNNDDKTTVLDIHTREITPLGGGISYDVTRNIGNVVSNFSIGYFKYWTSSKYAYYYNNENQSNALSKYGISNSKEFPTLISDETDAELYSAKILDDVSDDDQVISFRSNNFEHRLLNPGEWIMVQFDYIGVTGEIIDYLGWNKCQITEVTPNWADYTVKLTVNLYEVYGNYLQTNNGIDITNNDGESIVVIQ